MPTFYIVPPRKTQLGETGISIGGIDGIITNLPNNAPITGFGALKLDQSYNPTWTGVHTFNNTVYFNDNVIFGNDQQYNISSLYIPGQSAGDLIFFNGVNWTRKAITPNLNSVLTSSTSSVQWSKTLSLSTTETTTLKVSNLNGVLKASSGIVSGSSSISDLSNVLLNSPTDNQFLKFNQSLNKWENANVPLPDRSLIIRFLNGATPVDLGPDQEIAIIPYEPSDGTSVLTFTVNRITLFVETVSLTEECTIRVQRVAANTEFPSPGDPGADFVTTLTLPAGDSQVFISTNDPLFNETISSGQRLRLVIDAIGVNSANWTVQLEASALSLYQQPAGVVPISMGGTGRTTMGTANTVLTVGNYGDKLIYKDLIAGNNINITSAPIEVGGNEIGGTITITALQSKSICILSPTNTDDVTLFFTDKALTLEKAAVIIRGTSASIDYQIFYDQNRISTTATQVLSTTASSVNYATTTGQITNFSTNNTPLADSSIWLKITSVSNADEFHLTLFYQ